MLTILGLACFSGFCVSVKVKLTVLLLCVCVHFAWKSHPKNDLYCVGWDIKTLLTHSLSVVCAKALILSTWQMLLCVK